MKFLSFFTLQQNTLPTYFELLNQYQFIKVFRPQLKLFIYVNELERKQTKLLGVNATNVMNIPSRTTEK